MASRSKELHPPVLSMGEILVDFIVADGADALPSAEAFHARPGGAPANAAVALVRLGIDCAFCGVVGADPFGEKIRGALVAEGVDASRVRPEDQRATTLAFAWKDVRGDGHFWLLRGADALLSGSDVEAARIPESAAFIVGSVSLSTQPSRDAVVRAVTIARDSGIPVVFDVNLRPSLWGDLDEAVSVSEQVACMSRVVKLSLDDAIGLFGPGTTPEIAISRFTAHSPLAVVVTDGERGCWFATSSNYEPAFVPSFVVDAIEPTGAGDAFSAALIARLLESDWAPPTRDDLRYAAAAGALATTRQGAWDGLPTRSELDTFLNARQMTPARDCGDLV